MDFPLNWCVSEIFNWDPDEREYRITLTVTPHVGPNLVFFQGQAFIFAPPPPKIVHFIPRPEPGSPFLVSMSLSSRIGISVVGWLEGPFGAVQSWLHLFTIIVLHISHEKAKCNRFRYHLVPLYTRTLEFQEQRERLKVSL